MATNPKVRAALIAKTGWTKQTLSANVKKKKKIAVMSTAEAVCVLAHEHGVPIDKFIEAGERAQVRSLMQHAAPQPGAEGRGNRSREDPDDRAGDTVPGRVQVHEYLIAISKAD